MITSYKAAPDIEVLTSNVAIPGYGLVPINAFVIHGSEPVLVDTGAVFESDEFMTALQAVVDPADLKWIWLTHTDFDHIGTLHRLLAENAKLRVITTFPGVGIMGLSGPLPMDRVIWSTRDNRSLSATASSPPSNRPSSTTLRRPGSTTTSRGGSSAPIASGRSSKPCPRTPPNSRTKDLREGQVFWATVDSPWLHKVDRDAFAKELDGIRKMAPRMILSNHLPPAPGHLIERILGSLSAAPGAHPFVGPNQAAFEQMLQQMAAPPA